MPYFLLATSVRCQATNNLAHHWVCCADKDAIFVVAVLFKYALLQFPAAFADYTYIYMHLFTQDGWFLVCTSQSVHQTVHSSSSPYFPRTWTTIYITHPHPPPLPLFFHDEVGGGGILETPAPSAHLLFSFFVQIIYLSEPLNRFGSLCVFGGRGSYFVYLWLSLLQVFARTASPKYKRSGQKSWSHCGLDIYSQVLQSTGNLCR